MDHSGKPEKLEVNEDAARLRLEHQLRVVGSGTSSISGPPSIGPVGRSKILDSVKRFLPEMAKAEQDMNRRLQSGENLDIENCAADEQYIEMNVGIVEKDSTAVDDWSEDSEPDSPPSPADRDNSFTSDTDPDSSTGSEGDSTDDDSASPSSESSLSAGNLKLSAQNPIYKRPLIEEISPAEEPPNKKDK